MTRPPISPERIAAARDETATLWRCRKCGEWSHAKRDPIAHKPVRPHPGFPDDPHAWRPEWCGPFDRWTAQLDDPTPRGDLPHVGQPVAGREDENPNSYYDTEIPF